MLPQAETSLQKYFSFELSPYPLALFDESGMRKTRKSKLYSIFNSLDKVEINLENDFFVIDGGFLLHCVVWTGKTYDDICTTYVRYLKKHYPKCHVVFDGYKEIALKSMEHQRRYMKSAPDIVVTGDKPVTVKQDLFLANSCNKTAFIQVLRQKFGESGIQTSAADGDSDVLLVQKAINFVNTTSKRLYL